MTTMLAERPKSNGNGGVIETAVVRRGEFMPALSIEQAVERRNMIVAFTKSVMVRGIDYGEIPGTDKPTLLKPGAEKLNTLFGLSPRPVIIKDVEDWTGAEHGGEPFFYYLYRVQLTRDDRVVAEADGSSNSWEKKHRYRWVSQTDLPAHLDPSKLRRRMGSVREPQFAVERRETGGKYGKPASHWERFDAAIKNRTARRIEMPKKAGGTMAAWEIDDTVYRIPNEDAADVVNTLQKMAQKRALVAATLLATNASEFFTQDLEDMDMIDAPITSDMIRSHPTAPTNEENPDADFHSAWVAAVEARGGTEEAAAKILSGLLSKKGKSLSDWDGRERARLLKLMAEGSYDRWILPETETNEAPVAEPIDTETGEVKGVEDTHREPEPPDDAEKKWADFRDEVEAAALKADIPPAKLDEGMKHWRQKCGHVKDPWNTTEKQRQELLAAVQQRAGYFS